MKHCRVREISSKFFPANTPGLPPPPTLHDFNLKLWGEDGFLPQDEGFYVAKNLAPRVVFARSMFIYPRHHRFETAGFIAFPRHTGNPVDGVVG